MKKLFFLTAIISSFVAVAGNNSAVHSLYANVDSTPTYEMKQYWLVLLFRGAIKSEDKTVEAKIQEAHMNNIVRLHSEGKIIMAGPMGGKDDLRGIFIMDGKDSTEIANHMNTDSAIVTGRLRFEIHPWWTAKGKYEFK
jgi:uncharacterized protein YciI